MKIDLVKQFSLSEDQASVESIEERIRSGAKVTGTNMYILIFAILTACIGLNLNNKAIVIGAMLISPLMGPIISLAYGFANEDIVWIKSSFKAFFIQFFTGIISSILYFLISPISIFSNELIARTKPNIWDVMIAILGGCAAIIANTRKSYLGNVISGTAIATALMPPLCTIGYCIASAKWISALGACYLFTINTIFIFFSSFLGLHIMRISKKKTFLVSMKSRVILIIILFIMVIPSGFLAWQTVKESSVLKNVNMFLESEFIFENTQIVTSNIDYENKVIKVSVIGSTIKEEEIKKMEETLSDYSLEDYKFEVIQAYNEGYTTSEELEELLIGNDWNNQDNALKAKVDELKIILKAYEREKILEKDIAEEIQILFPEIESSGMTKMHGSSDENIDAYIIKTTEIPDDATKNKIQKWIESRLDKEIKVYYLY